jgi:phosphoribosylglycinamide formyltransferase-1
LSTARVAVLISGEGSNLQALIDAARAGLLGAQIALVVSNRGAARGLERARAAGIPARHIGAPRGTERDAYDTELANAIEAHAADLLVLAGFMRILGAAFIERFAGRALNVHPSLLPSYPGLDTHERVLRSGDRWHGATVHFVTTELDAGPAVIQYRIPVRNHDTVATLAERVHLGEHLILPQAVSWFAAGRLRLNDGAVMLDGRRLQSPVIMEGKA